MQQQALKPGSQRRRRPRLQGGKRFLLVDSCHVSVMVQSMSRSRAVILRPVVLQLESTLVVMVASLLGQG